MTTTSKKLRDQGYADALAGKPIEAFFEVKLAGLSLLRYTEVGRAQYEIGYRAAMDEMRKQGKR